MPVEHDQGGIHLNVDMMAESEYRKRLAANDPYISTVEDGDKTYLLGEEQEL
ncbi:MAG: hypothetical protein WC935_09250 [Thermoleophilia bacterium]